MDLITAKKTFIIIVINYKTPIQINKIYYKSTKGYSLICLSSITPAFKSDNPSIVSNCRTIFNSILQLKLHLLQI